MYKVVEKFISINGEGQKAGALSVFVRLADCNLKCSYCDTLWAVENAPYTRMTAEEILTYVQDSGIQNVTLTGGEPLGHEGIKTLIDKITDAGIFLEIETNGSINIEPFKNASKRLSFTVDYKLPSSGMEEHMNMLNYIQVDQQDTVKFVVGSQEDLKKAHEIILDYKLTEQTNVYLSPVFGMIESKDIVEYMVKHVMNGVQLQLQLHKYVWDPSQKGV